MIASLALSRNFRIIYYVTGSAKILAKIYTTKI